jgi:uncharacterized membrane protein
MSEDLLRAEQIHFAVIIVLLSYQLSVSLLCLCKDWITSQGSFCKVLLLSFLYHYSSNLP